MSWIEIIAMLTGIAGVLLTIKQNIWCFPVGIVNVSLYAYLFLTPGIRLYADALLQCIYILLLVYGWIRWKNDKEIPHYFNIGKKSSLKLLLIFILSTIIISLFFQEYTNASLPWLDATLMCGSLAAQWMIAKKYIENWIIWIAVNVIYLPLYIYKELYLTAFLYFIFLLLALAGYKEWKKYFERREA
jgi:nicotinamide mononucleotide transporter